MQGDELYDVNEKRSEGIFDSRLLSFFVDDFFASVSVLRLGVLPGWPADYYRVSYVKHSKGHASDGLREAKSSKRGAFS